MPSPAWAMTAMVTSRLVEMSAMPQKAQALLKAYLPQFQPTMVEHSTRKGGQIFYELEGQHDGRTVDVEVSEAGDIIMIDPFENGVVAVPQGKVDELLDLLPKLIEADERVIADVGGGISVEEAFKRHRN